MDLKPLYGRYSRGVLCQNGIREDFPRGSLSDTRLDCLAIEGIHHATVDVFAHSRIAWAAGAAVHVSPSPSPSLLLAACVRGDLPGESPGQRAGKACPPALARSDICIGC